MMRAPFAVVTTEDSLLTPARLIPTMQGGFSDRRHVHWGVVATGLARENGWPDLALVRELG